LFFLASILPAVNSVYIEKGINDFETSLDNGLMDSCWPMFQHDTRHTGRSPYAPTGNTPVLKWTYKMLGNRRQSIGLVFCSPVMAEDGTIYIADSHLVDGCLYALNPDGTEKWRYEHSDWVHSTPALVEDGTIFMGCDNGKLYAFNPDGTLKWDIVLGSRWITSAPVVDNNGTIYVGSTDEYFYAINPNGTIKWSYKMDHKSYSSPAIDDNGVIYIGSHDNYLYAFYHNGTLKWKFKANDVVKSPPSIDDDGIIYFGTWAYYDNVYALYPNGTVKWRFSVDDAVETSPAIGYNGDIYVGSYNGIVYSISPDGKKNWDFRAGSGGDEGWVIASAVIDKNGIIYIGSLDGGFFALNPDGSVLWQYDTNLGIEVSAAIGEDGTIYFAAHQPFGPSPRLYAFDVVDNQPPIRPYINGTSSGKIGHIYNYNISSTDPENQDIYYYIDWDDGTNNGWIGPYPSDENITVNHTWNNIGTYNIKIKARDIHGHESDWTTLEVTMPKNKMIYQFNSLFERLLYYLSFISKGSK
jgi:outer membrane protein assembly factor BamB